MSEIAFLKVWGCFAQCTHSAGYWGNVCPVCARPARHLNQCFSHLSQCLPQSYRAFGALFTIAKAHSIHA